MTQKAIKQPFVALVIGHGGASNDPGAVNSRCGTSELEFNTKLVGKVHDRLKGGHKVDSTIVHRRTYSQLPSDINSLDPDTIISFHCNAFNGKATGSEFIHYERSSNGKRLALILADEVHAVLHLPLRGDGGARSRGKGERGAPLLTGTKAPCVISEPFFIDNDSDLATAVERMDELADAIVRAIYRYHGV